MSDQIAVLITIRFETPEGRPGLDRFKPFRHRNFMKGVPPEDLTWTPTAMRELIKQLKRDRCRITGIEQARMQTDMEEEAKG